MLALSMGAASARTQISYKFQDEFNGGSGSAPDRSKWNYDLGSDNWGNNEIETYTNSRANSFQDGRGNLVIRVLKTPGSPGEFHPEAPTEPCVTISRYTALLI